MTTTDNPLKLLLHDFALEFARWVLNTEVTSAEPLPTELVSDKITADHISRVTLADGRSAVLHLEFQGPSSDPPMPERMLNYMSRLALYALSEGLELCSVILYVGHRAGANDSGVHALGSPMGGSAMQWHYHVLRLWQLQAEDLLQLEQPALAALIGQTQISAPEPALLEATRQIKTVPSLKQQKTLATILVGLLETEELITMAESLLEKDDILLSKPFFKKIRDQARKEALEEGRMEGLKEGRMEGRMEGLEEGRMEGLEEGRMEGLEEGRMEGLEEGRMEGLEEGRMESLRRTILQTLTVRLAASEAEMQAIEAQLATISNLPQLEALFTVALQAESLSIFQEGLPDNESSSA